MKQTTTVRDKAIAHYKKFYEQYHGSESDCDLSGIPTEEIWKMGDIFLNMVNDCAMETYLKLKNDECKPPTLGDLLKTY
jgi:hypothetical protein